MSSLTIPLDTFNLFPAAPTNHVMAFSRMPHVTFVLQEVGLPGMTATPARAAAPGMFVRHMPDRLTYDPLTVTLLVDEQLRAFRELHSWLRGITGGEDRSYLTARFVDDQLDLVWPDDRPVDRLPRLASTQACLTVVSGAKTPLLRVMFHNMFPTALGPIQWATNVSDTTPAMTCTATFEYDYYTIVELAN